MKVESKDELLILAVVGMPATGKSEVIKKLKEQFNFYHLYYGDITFDELKRRGLEVNEANERVVREGLRAGGDLGIYSKMILPKIEKAIADGHKKIILESMYNIFEYEVIHNAYPNNFKVLAIHSDQDIRVKRINSRPDRKLSKEELVSRQISEAKNLQKGTVISFADYHYVNNGDNMQVFGDDLTLFLRQRLDLEKENKKYTKDFNFWNETKKVANNYKHKSVKEGEIFWTYLGLNIGFEQDGKGEKFKRPMLVLKKFSKEIVLGIPLSTKVKVGSWYTLIDLNDGIERVLVMSQAKVIDTKRFDDSIYQISEEELQIYKDKFIDLLKS